MKNKKLIVFLGMFAFTLAVVSNLHAQSNATLKSGVYNYSGNSGAGKIIIQLSTNNHNAIIYGNDGKVVARGKLRINGTRVNVDFGDDGFEIWTIVDNETFKDALGLTFHWVRFYKNDEL